VPRRPRIFVEGGIYHVYNRFARGADLFSEPEEAIQFLEILRKARARDGLAVLAWCLMPNHYHLALITALAIERWGITAKGLSGVVGRRPEAVTRWAYRGAEIRQESEEFSAAYEKLDRELALWQRGSRWRGFKNRYIVGPGT
jgi:REP element-mobilizing transposase RayT